MKSRPLGGKGRIGTGEQIKTDLKTFNRSTFNISQRLKTTVSTGPIVPVFNDIALPGTTHDIDPDFDMLTGPTVGPLFGTFKADINFYEVPFRLYQPKLHNNRKGVGLEMDKEKIPQLLLTLPNPISTDYEDLDNYQINPSHVFNYLGMRGAGIKTGDGNAIVKRYFNGATWLGYNDICANYYSNKQEEIGAMVHTEPINEDVSIVSATLDYVINEDNEEVAIPLIEATPPYTSSIPFGIQQATEAYFVLANWTEAPIDYGRIRLLLRRILSGDVREYRIDELFKNLSIQPSDAPAPNDWVIKAKNPTDLFIQLSAEAPQITIGYLFNTDNIESLKPNVVTFPLSDIDDMRDTILSRIRDTAPFVLTYPTPDEELYTNDSPYILPMKYTLGSNGRIKNTATKNNQEGLWVSTYMRDVFNAWLNTEAINIVDTVSAIPVRDLNGGQVVYVNEINVKQKVWAMFNAIQTNGADYVGYIDANFDHELYMGIYSPVFCGGITKELTFQQILSTAEAGGQPLGTLGGRGVLSKGKRGGRVTIKTDEPSMIMAVFTLTPRVDYSQGNDWWTNLKTYDEFHSPWLDQIGFQDDITDKRAWWDTQITGNGDPATPWGVTFRSAGKLTAWIDYQTSFDRIKGNFAIENNQMWMTLARRYEPTNFIGSGNETTPPRIKDLTTYIDPARWNYIFADTSPDAMNFWLQCDFKCHARRKMSSKTQPSMN